MAKETETATQESASVNNQASQDAQADAPIHAQDIPETAVGGDIRIFDNVADPNASNGNPSSDLGKQVLEDVGILESEEQPDPEEPTDDTTTPDPAQERWNDLNNRMSSMGEELKQERELRMQLEQQIRSGSTNGVERPEGMSDEEWRNLRTSHATIDLEDNFEAYKAQQKAINRMVDEDKIPRSAAEEIVDGQSKIHDYEAMREANRRYREELAKVAETELKREQQLEAQGRGNVAQHSTNVNNVSTTNSGSLKPRELASKLKDKSNVEQSAAINDYVGRIGLEGEAMLEYKNEVLSAILSQV